MTMPLAADPRIDQVLSMVAAFAAGQFTFRVEPSDRRDEIDAIIAGLNMLGEELEETLRKLAAMHERLLQSEKMAAIGQLAGGVAHEINNPLCVILGFAQGLERRVPEKDLLRLPVTSIVRESLRCKALVQELLAFSRTGKVSAEPSDVNALARGAARLLEARARTLQITVAQELAEELPVIAVNRTQMEQVLVNLGMNALDAMSAGGRLTLRTLREQGGVRLEVADSGGGIPEEIRSRIFEPFFTTKEVGEGTGLGLSLVYEVVDQHGGTIDVQSEIGVGTTMVVHLPVGSNGERPRVG
jgi:two-component system, NtrC family, sensor kinase